MRPGRSEQSSGVYAASLALRSIMPRDLPAASQIVRYGKGLTHNDIEAQHGNLQATEDLEAELELEAAAFLRRAHLRAASLAFPATGR